MRIAMEQLFQVVFSIWYFVSFSCATIVCIVLSFHEEERGILSLKSLQFSMTTGKK